jgi:hypothetical protein
MEREEGGRLRLSMVEMSASGCSDDRQRGATEHCCGVAVIFFEKLRDWRSF